MGKIVGEFWCVMWCCVMAVPSYDDSQWRRREVPIYRMQFSTPFYPKNDAQRQTKKQKSQSIDCDGGNNWRGSLGPFTNIRLLSLLCKHTLTHSMAHTDSRNNISISWRSLRFSCLSREMRFTSVPRSMFALSSRRRRRVNGARRKLRHKVDIQRNSAIFNSHFPIHFNWMSLVDCTFLLSTSRPLFPPNFPKEWETWIQIDAAGLLWIFTLHSYELGYSEFEKCHKLYCWRIQFRTFSLFCVPSFSCSPFTRALPLQSTTNITTSTLSI